jgi:hypothetical protein
MSRHAFAARAITAGILVGCGQVSQKYQAYELTHGATARVTTILTGIQKAHGKSDQKSLCLWYNGSI